ncbi:DinB family protein [uncultured Aquimarina sp.]|uniref:DinB family protein n=1 Tax=uncultured Aquimarina sp. TaxID=575652 RepID=UPI00260D26EF|nr:DinB family protein [uncultured Aquimarina sp.]
MNTTELNRFTSMYQHQVAQTIKMLEPVTESQYSEIPIDNEVMFMGSRVNKINITTLVKHLIVAESHWFVELSEVNEGDTIPIPKNAEIVKDVNEPETLLHLLGKTSKLGIETVRTFDETQLNTRFNFVGQQFTVMGFLWMLYSHHGYHKGQIDQLMRQMGHMPIEYLEYETTSNLIG